MKKLHNLIINQVRRDLSEDHIILYILSITTMLSGFWFWYRVPNFAGADEFSRLIQPMKAAGFVVANPSFESFQAAILDGRALGATFYLYGIILIPLFCVVLMSGQLNEFSSLSSITSRWTLWHEVPSWFWATAIVLGRITVVVFAIGCVYLTYRLGTHLRDRRTGRYASLLLALSFGFISMAHEIGEDIPMLFFLLASVYSIIRFLKTGKDELFLVGTVLGGTAIAFKLTAGVIVFAIGSVLFLRAFRYREKWRSELLRPKLILYGVVSGILLIYIGIPSVLVSGPSELVTRVTHSTGIKTSSSGGLTVSIWFWMAKGYLNGMGLPMFISVIFGAPASFLISVKSLETDTFEIILILVVLAPYFIVFSGWEYVRMHHLLPTFPFLLLLLGVSLSYIVDHHRSVGKALLWLVILSTSVYACMGVIQYADEPRDQATEWMETNVEEDEYIEVYENSITDIAAVHGKEIQHYPYQEKDASVNTSLVENESNYTNWMVSSSERKPEYIQLTSNELQYLNPESPYPERYPRRSKYIRELIEEEREYRIVAEFGSRPAFESPKEKLIWAGIKPRPRQKEPYIVILERKE